MIKNTLLIKEYRLQIITILNGRFVMKKILKIFTFVASCWLLVPNSALYAGKFKKIKLIEVNQCLENCLKKKVSIGVFEDNVFYKYACDCLEKGNDELINYTKYSEKTDKETIEDLFWMEKAVADFWLKNKNDGEILAMFHTLA